MLPHQPAEINMEDYASFLPPARRKSLVPPVSEWWPWGNHRVHLLRLRDANAPVRLLVVHGAGAHAAALWPVASLLAGQGVDLTAVDLPLYGRTVTTSRGTVTYEDWVDLLVDLISAEDDGRPVILLGASIGGLLTVEAAARSRRVAAVVATCLLDPRERYARSTMTRLDSFALAFMPLLKLVRGPIARFPVKISWIARSQEYGARPQSGTALRERCTRRRRVGPSRVPRQLHAAFTFRGTHSTLPRPPDAPRARRVDPSGAQRGHSANLARPHHYQTTAWLRPLPPRRARSAGSSERPRKGGSRRGVKH